MMPSVLDKHSAPWVTVTYGEDYLCDVHDNNGVPVIERLEEEQCQVVVDLAAELAAERAENERLREEIERMKNLGWTRAAEKESRDARHSD